MCNERDCRFLILCRNGEVLLACFENYKIAKGFIEILQVVINLSEILNDVARALASPRIEKFGSSMFVMGKRRG